MCYVNIIQLVRLHSTGNTFPKTESSFKDSSWDMFVKMYSRYSLVSSLLAMHVSIKLYAAALASAPVGEPENIQFLRLCF